MNVASKHSFLMHLFLKDYQVNFYYVEHQYYYLRLKEYVRYANAVFFFHLF
jgi:hypothetical protein